MSALVSAQVVWALALAVSVAVVAAYWISFRRRDRRERDRAAEARVLGIDRPAGHYPYIDPAVCIGCGGCVAACPEKDVLGIVGGLAAVVNGARCVGIGECAKACPVGAIEIALGEIKGRADVPCLDPRRQTAVPGLYVAGELGGLALIRNAVEQGRDTVRWIAGQTRCSPQDDPRLLDLAIVGAGPAGLAGALAAAEAGLRYVVFEQADSLGGTIYNFPRRKLTHVQTVELPLHGPLRRSEYTKEELLELFGGLLERHRLAVRFGERVLDVTRQDDDTFEIRTGRGATRARRVLLALGRRGTPRKLGVPGEQLSKVMYQVRDAEQYRNQRLLCVGGGDSAVEAALGLARQAGNRVTLSYRRPAFHRLKRKNRDLLEAAIRRRRIEVLLPSEVVAIAPGSARLRTSGGELLLDNDLVFVLIGGEPPFDLLRRAGVRFGADGATG